MENYKVRIATQPNGKQIGVKVYSLKIENEGYQEFMFGEYDIEYFDKNEIPLEDGDYPGSMFEQVFLMALIVAPGEPTPISNYRGLKIRKAFRKYE